MTGRPGGRMLGVAMRALPLLFLLSACAPDTARREAFDATSGGWLLNVSGSSASDLYAVGGEPARGRITRYDGASWAEVQHGLDVPLLNWGHGFGPNDVTVVGNGGTVVHFDGSGWTEQSTPTTETLWGVWGAAPDDLWAVGGSGFPGATATILHFDGSEWSDHPPPALMGASVHAFFKVWGTSASNVYIVGQRGTVLHWDGTAWAQELTGASDDLISLWGTGPDHILAVGGRGNGVVARWDGAAWQSERLTPLPGLNGVWMRADGVAHVAGIRGTLGTIDFATLEVEEASILDSRDFHSVFGAEGRLVAVGGNLSSSAGPFTGIAYERGLASNE